MIAMFVVYVTSNVLISLTDDKNLSIKEKLELFNNEAVFLCENIYVVKKDSWDFNITTESFSIKNKEKFKYPQTHIVNCKPYKFQILHY